MLVEHKRKIFDSVWVRGVFLSCLKRGVGVPEVKKGCGDYKERGWTPGCLAFLGQSLRLGLWLVRLGRNGVMQDFSTRLDGLGFLFWKKHKERSDLLKVVSFLMV